MPGRIAILLDRGALALWQFVAIADIVREHPGAVALIAPEAADPRGVARVPPSGDLARLDPTAPVSPSSAFALVAEPPVPHDDPAYKAASFDLIVDLRAHPDQRPPPLHSPAGFYVVFGRATASDWDSAFWDVYHAAPESIVRVLCRERDGTILVVARASVATNIRSVEKTRAALLWKASAMLAQAIRQYATLTPAERKASALARFGPPQAAAPSEAPGPAARALLRARVLGRRLLMPGSLMREQWRIAIRPRLDGPAWGSPAWHRGFHFIDCPVHEFWADPFLFEHGGQTCVFFESYDWRTRLGRIACGIVDEKGRLNDVRVIIENPYHMSNPLVFGHAGGIVMIPETLAARRVELYRCLDFPWRWERADVLLDDIDICDPVPIEVDGRWWLFGSVVGRDGSSWNELHLFWSDALTGRWTPHPLNPVVADVHCARPGGRMFKQDGTIYRYAQDCGGGYGSRLHLCRVDELSESTYRQSVIATIDPFRVGMNGVHAYDATNRFEVIDGRHYQIQHARYPVFWPVPRWLRFN